MIRLEDRLYPEVNMFALMRERGKIVPGSRREGHNVFTVTGRNLLSKLCAWQTIGSSDVPYTQRRIRWIGVGVGSQLEVSTVSQLVQPTPASGTYHLAALNAPQTFPNSTSVEFSYEFSTSEVSTGGASVAVTEAGLFADIAPASSSDGTEDVAAGGPTDTTLDPETADNPPVAYKAFEALTKTPDFTLEIRWIFRF